MARGQLAEAGDLTVEVASAYAGCWVVIDETGFAGDDAATLAERDTLWSHWLIRLAAVVARLSAST